MEAIRYPLSNLANLLERYGGNRQKVYNDKNRGKLPFEIEETKKGYAILIEPTPKGLDALLDYFGDALRGPVERTQVINQGIPVEKYEKALREIADLKGELERLKERLSTTENSLKEAEGEKYRLERELKEKEKELSKKERELRECRKEAKLLRLHPVLKELEEKVGKEKVEEILELLEGE